MEGQSKVEQRIVLLQSGQQGGLHTGRLQLPTGGRLRLGGEVEGGRAGTLAQIVLNLLRRLANVNSVMSLRK